MKRTTELVVADLGNGEALRVRIRHNIKYQIRQEIDKTHNVMVSEIHAAISKHFYPQYITVVH